MARQVTLSTLRRQARELADQETGGSSAFVDDTELNGMINSSLGLWQGLLIQAVPERFEQRQTITADGSESYNLPADYQATLGVHYEYSTDAWIQLERAMYPEAGRYSRDEESQAVAYRIKGDTIVLLPKPSSGTYYHDYVSTKVAYSSGGTAQASLSNDTDYIDGVNGWEQWIVYDCAIKMLIKEESLDTASVLLQERNRIQNEVEAAARDREMGNPMKVVDTRRRSSQRDPRFRYDVDFWAQRG